MFQQHIWNLISLASSTPLSQVLIFSLSGLSQVFQRWPHADLGLHSTSLATVEGRYHFPISPHQSASNQL